MQEHRLKIFWCTSADSIAVKRWMLTSSREHARKPSRLDGGRRTVVIIDDDVCLGYLLRQLCRHQPKESDGIGPFRGSLIWWSSIWGCNNLCSALHDCGVRAESKMARHMHLAKVIVVFPHCLPEDACGCAHPTMHPMTLWR